MLVACIEEVSNNFTRATELFALLCSRHSAVLAGRPSLCPRRRGLWTREARACLLCQCQIWLHPAHPSWKTS